MSHGRTIRDYKKEEAMEKREVKVLYGEEDSKEKIISLEEGTSYEELAKDLGPLFSGQITLARVDNQLHELGEIIAPSIKEVTLLDTCDTDGYRVYMRTLSFVFLVAVQEIFPDKRVVFEHSISGGTYCSIREGQTSIVIDSWTKKSIQEQMQKIIDLDQTIERLEYSLERAKELFRKENRQDKVQVLEYRNKENVAIYKLGQVYDSFYGYLLPSTGHVSTFDLELFNHGLVLIGPERNVKGLVRNFVPQRKLSEAYKELESWSELQGISQVSHLNKLIEEGNIGEVCRVTEALQGHKIMSIAQEIHKNNKRIVLISAPSSSGKTSFAYKLRTSLRVLGLRPTSISLDDYYVNRVDTPLDEKGNYDFESLYAIDLDLFNKDLNSLLKGQKVERIRFDFMAGVRVYTGEDIQLYGSDPIIIEGIHALNPLLTSHIEETFKYKIYLSVITQINLDDHNRIPTTDLRLMRRMARDKEFRGKPVENTILEWKNVREGEQRNIFPYQEEADVVFNSSFIYEIAALKAILMDDLRIISKESPASIEAKRLLSILEYFLPLKDTSDIVNTSILREFIGGSKIVY